MNTILRTMLAAIFSVASLTTRAATWSSTFNSGVEGWTGVRLPNSVAVRPILQGPFTPAYLSTGGHPGGNICITDTTSPASLFWFSAPAAFLGNQSNLYGAPSVGTTAIDTQSQSSLPT